ncbi:MAG: hypothetical protein ABI210_02405, partial [Abditibacteriaceae bacterium]
SAIYNLRIGEDVIFVESQAAKELRSAPPDFQSSLNTVKEQMKGSLSEDSVIRTANQLQKSIDMASAQLKKNWKSGFDSKTSENDEKEGM